MVYWDMTLKMDTRSDHVFIWIRFALAFSLLFFQTDSIWIGWMPPFMHKFYKPDAKFTQLVFDMPNGNFDAISKLTEWNLRQSGKRLFCYHLKHSLLTIRSFSNVHQHMDDAQQISAFRLTKQAFARQNFSRTSHLQLGPLTFSVRLPLRKLCVSFRR